MTKQIEFKLKDFLQENLKFENNKLFFGSSVKLFELSNLLKIDYKKLAKLLKIDPVDQILDDDQIAEIALTNNFDFQKVKDISFVNVVDQINEVVFGREWPNGTIITKAPVVTIMGHVDHGKTTLLDTIRKANVAAKEIGGITQKIGAYQVIHNKKPITFIDTPGHEAFSKMRANGATVTDICIIVVAADDSIMPQTKESVDHAKAANLQMIVAINKIDKPGANAEKVKQQMTDIGVLPEEWGGTTPFVEISGLKGTGIDKLLETILLLAEVKDIKAYSNMPASGTVLESNIDKFKGNYATLIIQNGVLNVGDSIIIDSYLTKVKSIRNDKGEQVKQATSSMPVEVIGLSGSPAIGSKFVVVNNLKEANEVVSVLDEVRKNKSRKQRAPLSIEELFALSAGTGKKHYNIIVKANGSGVLEAIVNKLKDTESENTKVSIVRSDVGEITSTDIQLAQTTKSVIYSFGLKLSEQLKKQAESLEVDVKNFDIIYKMFEEIEELLIGKKEKKYELKQIGEAEIQQIFKVSKLGNIAGFIVKSGHITNKSKVDIYRKGKLIGNDNISTLKHMKDNVKERKEGQEGGLTLNSFDSFEVGDRIVAFEEVEV